MHSTNCLIKTSSNSEKQRPPARGMQLRPLPERYTGSSPGYVVLCVELHVACPRVSAPAYPLTSVVLCYPCILFIRLFLVVIFHAALKHRVEQMWQLRPPPADFPYSATGYADLRLCSSLRSLPCTHFVRGGFVFSRRAAE